jgi:hypothetical protein
MQTQQQSNPVTDMVQYQIETTMHLADAVFSGTEKIDRAVLDGTHHAIERHLKLARAVTDMRDPEKMADLKAVISAKPDQAISCQQQILNAWIEMQSEIGRSVRESIERFNHVASERAAQAMEQAGRSKTDSSMVNPFAGMLSMWEQAFREATRLASESTQIMQQGAESAGQMGRDAAHKTMDKANRALHDEEEAYEDATNHATKHATKHASDQDTEHPTKHAAKHATKNAADHDAEHEDKRHSRRK